MEKCSQQELVLWENLRKHRGTTEGDKRASDEIKQTREKNQILEQKIRSLCSKVIQLTEDQLHHITD